MTSEILNAELTINSLEYFRFYTKYEHKILWMNSLTHLECDCEIFVVTIGNPFLNKSSISENKESSFVLKYCYSRKKYLSKLKQYELRDALSEGFLFKCFIVSINMLFMLSWQQILSCNFHNVRVTWLFYNFLKLEVHILHGIENNSISNVWTFWLVRCDVIFGEANFIFPKIFF